MLQPADSDVLSKVESAYHQHFETEPARASISFVGVEPIEILLYKQAVSTGAVLSTYVSLGMSRHPMVASDQALADPAGPRAELLLTIRGDEDEVWRRLAVLAAAPAVESLVYADGARVDLGEPWLAGSRCTGVVVTTSPLLPVTTSVGVVEIFQVHPATQTELAWARVHGNELLLARWREATTDLGDLFRAPVSLD